FANNDFDLVLRGQPISFADIRFIMPQMPARGEGTLDFRLRWRGDTTTYIAQKADIRIDSARAGGDFAISMVGDSLWFHDTDIRFSSMATWRSTTRAMVGAGWLRKARWARRAVALASETWT